MSGQVAAAPAAERSEPAAGVYRLYVLFILTLCYTLSFIDSKLPFILLSDIKRDLHLSDGAMGFITGPAFSLVYAVTAFPIAKVADARSRKLVLSIAVLAWSACTSLGGLVRTGFQLGASRSGVALGEAACTPAAHSIIADHFAPTERGWAISVFMSGNVIGTAIALGAGGVLSATYGWRATLSMTGVAGFVLAGVLLLTVREPRRRPVPRDAVLSGAEAPEGLIGLLRDRAFRFSAIGGALLCLSLGNQVAWTPAYIGRHFHLGAAQIGLTLSVATLISGMIGTLAGGIVNDAMNRRSPGGGYRFLAAAFAICAGVRVVSFLTDDFVLFLGLFCVASLLMTLYSGATYATVQSLVGPRSRSRATALLLFFCNAFGISGGAWLTGVLSDALIPAYGADSLRIASLALCLSSLPAALFYWRGSRALTARAAVVAA